MTGGVLAQGPYGELAEALVCVEVRPRTSVGRGTCPEKIVFEAAPLAAGRGQAVVIGHASAARKVELHAFSVAREG